ncbi:MULTISPECIES: hypothetical protein [unclassified Roseitalea]|uniref:F0F1 ATP synthase subunit B family protein n=1 Tax=unclassified Roseitalea TaxID=2639107 RepID=UPI00273F6189|nr:MULTISPECIES: hypothetical protein [unclassified Roseitalea]
MQIDWLTVAAQIVNFLILIWLLQRFLYKPITRAMARREERIEERLADARAARKDAEDEAQAWRDRQQALEERKDEILQEARRDADALRDRLEAEIRRQMEHQRDVFAEHLNDERSVVEQALRKRMARHVLKAMRRIVADFADTELQAQLASRFAHRVETLDDGQRKRLADAAGRTHDPVLVETGVELPAPARSRITRAIHDSIADGIKVDYRTVEDVLMGIRITIGDQIVEWSAGEYLDRVETIVAESLELASHGPDGQARERSHA